MKDFLVILALLLFLVFHTQTRICGRPRICHCFSGLSEIKCVNKELFTVPNFEKEGSFDILDIRKNHIKFIPAEVLKKFAFIDVRENREFDCDDFLSRLKNVVYPVVLSDCEDEDGDEEGVRNRRPSSTEISRMKKKFHPYDDTDDLTVSNMWTLASTPGYFLNKTRDWIYTKKSLENQMHIFMTYAIFATVTVIAIIVSVFCGKKIVTRCRRRRTDPPHNILQEEDEETSFSLPEMAGSGSYFISGGALKQE
jgi:hypothetical protein